MSLLHNTTRGRRRRAVLAVAAAVLAAGAGGFLSYRVYRSEAFRRRREQVARVLGALSLLGQAAEHGAESAALLSADFKNFLLSDADSVPRSLRQAFKITHCSEFQHSCTVLSAALARGLLRGLSGKNPTCEDNSEKDDHCFPTPNNPPEDLEIKEICLSSNKQGCSDSPGTLKGEVWPIVNSERQWQEWEVKKYPSGTKRVGRSLDEDGRGQRESNPPEDLPDRLLGKLFSEPGVGFASAVAGTLACSFVKALFDGLQYQGLPHTPGTAPSSLGDKKSLDVQPSTANTAQEKRHGSSKIIDVICTQQCRGLIAECIQTLVGTAVSVYIDKTKDVNFYDDMVAGITNPSHKDPMKDLLASVCNGAVETLVKTSHNVIFAKKSGQPGSNTKYHYPQQERWGVEVFSEGPFPVQSHLNLHTTSPSMSTEIHCQEIIQSVTDHACTSSGSLEMCEVNAPLILKASKDCILQDSEREIVSGTPQKAQGDNSGVQSFIDGISKTLAIPSNHKLVVDVAGTMSSEAVRSFVDVVMSTVSSHFHDKLSRGWGRGKSGVSEQLGDKQALQLGEKSRDVAIKAFLLATICLAICLHMLTGIRIIESV